LKEKVPDCRPKKIKTPSPPRELTPPLRERTPREPRGRPTYQDWTNTFKRHSVYWNKPVEILEPEYIQGSPIRAQCFDTCCGNSPPK